MSDSVIKFENISKQYRLGNIGTGTLSHDLKRWWNVTILRKEDPYLKIGQVNDRTVKATGDYIWALKEINFEVKQGEVLGIIGKNGAGKSTLLKILSRVTTPTTGRILARGRVASLLEVGTGFHPEMTGRENIFMNGSIMGMTKAEIIQKMDEIVDFAGVEKYIETPVKRYSSGMMVRLGFAIAAHLEPEILVVDEVLAVGDAEFQKKAIGKMQDVSKGEGRTVLFVSHNMDAILKLTTKCIILNNGRISCSGITQEIIKNYLNFNKATGLIYENKSSNKSPHISSVSLRTSLPNNIQVNGESMSVFIELNNYEPIRGACFSFQIIDSNERNFVHQWIFATDQTYCNEIGVYQLECKIPNLKLYMGKYYLKCYFSEPPGGKVFEILENICPFEVVMYETSRSMFSWYPDSCAYLEEGYWNVKRK